VSRKNEERRELWRQRIAQQGQSGQSVRAYCNEQGIGEHSFYSWRQRLREEKGPVQFALVDTKSAGQATPQPIELVLAGGDHLRIPADAAMLRLVLSVLREA
jgi:transposase-like protein